jgi:hypothetical protein
MASKAPSKTAKQAAGYIYMLCEREFLVESMNVPNVIPISTDKVIVKIGRTKDMFQRIKGYPKGSMLLCCNHVDSVVSTETEIIRHFMARFIHRKDLGREYFESINLSAMIAEMTNCICRQQCAKAKDEMRSILVV